MRKSIAEAVVNALAKKEQIFVPVPDEYMMEENEEQMTKATKIVVDGVRNTEYALAHGLPFKIAVAYGVSVITGRNNTKIPA